MPSNLPLFAAPIRCRRRAHAQEDGNDVIGRRTHEVHQGSEHMYQLQGQVWAEFVSLFPACERLIIEIDDASDRTLWLGFQQLH